MKYTITGTQMQALEIELDEGEKIYSDSGKLVSKTEGVVMTPRLVGGIMGAITRGATGATGMLTEFKSNKGVGDVALAGTMPGKIVPIELKEGDQFVAEHYAFIAAEDSVKFTMQTVSLASALMGGAGLVLQKFVGPGTVFIHVIGDVIEYKLDGSESVEVDPGHLAGFDATLSYNVKLVDNVKTMMFGGLGLFLATFKGKGRVLLHSVSRYKLAMEMFSVGMAQAKKKG